MGPWNAVSRIVWTKNVVVPAAMRSSIAAMAGALTQAPGSRDQRQMAAALASARRMTSDSATIARSREPSGDTANATIAAQAANRNSAAVIRAGGRVSNSVIVS